MLSVGSASKSSENTDYKTCGTFAAKTTACNTSNHEDSSNRGSKIL